MRLQPESLLAAWLSVFPVTEGAITLIQSADTHLQSIGMVGNGNLSKYVLADLQRVLSGFCPSNMVTLHTTQFAIITLFIDPKQ